MDELFSYSRLWVQGWADGCRQWGEWKRKEIFDQSRETLGQSRFEGHWTFLGLQMTSGRMGQSRGGAGGMEGVDRKGKPRLTTQRRLLSKSWQSEGLELLDFPRQCLI